MVSPVDIGSDGRTEYGRSRDKPHRKELPIFGECVFFLSMDRTGGRANKLEAKFLNGVYLALRLGTNELYIGTATGVARAAAMKRKTEPARSVWVLLNAIQADTRSTRDEVLAAKYPIAAGGGEEPLPVQSALHGVQGGVLGPRKI